MAVIGVKISVKKPSSLPRVQHLPIQTYQINPRATEPLPLHLNDRKMK
jgi:hypothetical protein